MRRLTEVLVLAVFVFANSATFAQTPPIGFGKVVSQQEVKGWMKAVGPAGKELLPGKGTAKQGAAIYTKSCVFCHGPEGTNGPYNSLRGEPMFTFATSIWDYIHRAMPRQLANPGAQERQLSPDEVYALTAYLLYLNGFLKENDVLDEKNITKIIMLDRNKK